MSPRLLGLICLLGLTHGLLAQQSGTASIPGTCPVTKPTQASRFVPPSPYATQPPANYFWFGTDKLWAMLPVDGAWRGLRGYTADDPTFRQKLSLWRQGYDWHAEPMPKLTVTGRRLDGQSPSLIANRANNVTTQPASMMVGVNFPTLGCWEITAHYGDDESTFTMWVSK